MPEVLASALAREHAEELIRLEADELKRLRRTYEQARKEILARLSETPGDTFTAQQLRSVQVQVEAGLRGMVKSLKADTSAGVKSLTSQGIEQTVAEIAWWDTKFRGGATQRIAGAAARKVLKPQALLLHQYEASLDAYGSNLISEVQGRLGVHLVKNSSWREMSLDIAGKLENNAIQGARWRAERIVRTEVVDALSLGHMAGLKEGAQILPGLRGQWDATIDKRTSSICLRLNGRVRELGQPFGSYRGQPIVRPPAIPNCRSRVVPWHADWTDYDDTIDPKTAPKPVVKEHEPGPKPVTKTEKKKATQAAHQAVVQSIASGATPSVTETQALSVAARSLHRMEGLSGDSLDEAVAKQLKSALAEGQAAHHKAVAGLEAEVAQARLAYQKAIENATDWGKDITQAEAALNKKLEALAALAGDVEGSVDAWIGGEVKATYNLGKSAVLDRAKTLADEYVQAVVAGDGTAATWASKYLQTRTWHGKLLGAKDPVNSAKAALLDLDDRAKDLIKKAAVQAKADELNDQLAVLADSAAPAKEKFIAAREILQADDDVVARLAADLDIPANSFVSDAKGVIADHIYNGQTGVVKLLVDAKMDTSAAKQLFATLDESYDLIGMSEKGKKAAWNALSDKALAQLKGTQAATAGLDQAVKNAVSAGLSSSAKKIPKGHLGTITKKAKAVGEVQGTGSTNIAANARIRAKGELLVWKQSLPNSQNVEHVTATLKMLDAGIDLTKPSTFEVRQSIALAFADDDVMMAAAKAAGFDKTTAKSLRALASEVVKDHAKVVPDLEAVEAFLQTVPKIGLPEVDLDDAWKTVIKKSVTPQDVQDTLGAFEVGTVDLVKPAPVDLGHIKILVYAPSDVIEPAAKLAGVSEAQVFAWLEKAEAALKKAGEAAPSYTKVVAYQKTLKVDDLASRLWDLDDAAALGAPKTPEALTAAHHVMVASDDDLAAAFARVQGDLKNLPTPGAVKTSAQTLLGPIPETPALDAAIKTYESMIALGATKQQLGKQAKLMLAFSDADWKKQLPDWPEGSIDVYKAEMAKAAKAAGLDVPSPPAAAGLTDDEAYTAVSAVLQANGNVPMAYHIEHAKVLHQATDDQIYAALNKIGTSHPPEAVKAKAVKILTVSGEAPDVPVPKPATTADEVKVLYEKFGAAPGGSAEELKLAQALYDTDNDLIAAAWPTDLSPKAMKENLAKNFPALKKPAPAPPRFPPGDAPPKTEEGFKLLYQKYAESPTGSADELSAAKALYATDDDLIKSVWPQTNPSQFKSNVAEQVPGVAAPAAPPTPTLKPYPKTQTGAPDEITLPSGKKATRYKGSSGSNPGGFYRTADGEDYFIKFPNAVGQVGAEDVSADLARQMGLKTKDYAVVAGDKHVGIASPKIEFDELTGKQMAGWKSREELADQFVHAAWTQNWDVAGLGFDNLVATKSGDLMVVDYGGSLLWRAQGGLKKDGLPSVVDELKTLRSGTANAQTAKAFGGLSDQDIAKAIQRKLVDLDDEDIIAAVVKGNFSSKDSVAIQKGLIARKEYLDDWADGVLGGGKKGTPDQVKKALLGDLPNDPDVGIAWKSGASSDAKERYRKALDGDVTSLCKLGRRLWNGTPQMEQNQDLSLRFLQVAWQLDKAAVKKELGDWTQTMADVLGALEKKGAGALSIQTTKKEIARLAKVRAAKEARERAEQEAKAAAAKIAWEKKKAEFAAKKAAYDAELAEWQAKKTAYDEAAKAAIGKKQTTTGYLTKAYEKKVDTWDEALSKSVKGATAEDTTAYFDAKAKFQQVIDGQNEWLQRAASIRSRADRFPDGSYQAEYYLKKAKNLENKSKRIIRKAKVDFAEEIEPLAAKANLFRIKATPPGDAPKPPEGLYEAAAPKAVHLKEQPTRAAWEKMAREAAEAAGVDYADAYRIMLDYSNGGYRHLRQAHRGKKYDGEIYVTPKALRDKERMENLSKMLREMPGYEPPETGANRMFTTHKEGFTRGQADKDAFIKMLDHAVETGEPLPPWGAITSGSTHNTWSGHLHYRIYGRTSGVMIDPVSSNRGEKEIFLLPEMRVKVRKWYKDGQNLIVECEEYFGG
jgi:hypothetical protein